MQPRSSLLQLILHLIDINYLSIGNKLANLDLGKLWMLILTMSSLKNSLSYLQNQLKKGEDTGVKPEVSNVLTLRIQKVLETLVSIPVFEK